MPRAAAIDIGTNSVLLLIAAPSDEGPKALCERATITRLGGGVDRTGRLSDDASRRTLRCLRDYAQDLQRWGVEHLDVVGTSALRDAAECGDFLGEASRILGVFPRVLSGKQEATLTFRGALSALAARGPLVVCDIGGGSTEIIAGEAGPTAGHAVSAVSLDLGSVRLSERHLHDDPPAASQVAALRADVRAALARAPAATQKAQLVGVGGTVTTLAAIHHRLRSYDAAVVHGARIPAVAVEGLAAQLASLPLAQRSRLQGLSSGRADIIVAGAWLTSELVSWSGAGQLLVSDRGLRWGLVARLLDRPS